MNKVKEVCLGVAVAGVVAGAGSTVACAVAYADPAGPDASSSSDSPAAAARPKAGSAARGSDRADRVRSARPSAAAATAPDDAPRAERGAAQDPAPRAAQRADRAAVAVPAAPVVAVDAAEVSGPARTVDVPATGSAAQTAAPVTVAVIAPAASPAGSAAPLGAVRAAAPAATVLPAPAAPLLPVLPLLPLPTPAVPAGAVSTGSSWSATRSRSAAATVSAVQIGDPSATHVLLIGTDGTNLSKILADPANTGFFNLMDRGITGAASIVGHTTISGPSWSTILTGVWDNKTGVINNLFNPAPYTPWPTVFNQLEYFDSDINTAIFADWKFMNDIAASGSYPVAADDNFFVEFDTSWEKTDDTVVDRTIDYIANTSAAESTFVFSYQVAVDEAGHAHGGGSPQYAAAVTNTSNNIQRIMDAIDAWEADNPGEEWTVIVTTDHGHQQSTGFGHGFQSPNETSTFVIFDLEGDDADDGKQNLAYSNADVTPTIVSLFGAPSRSDFDGVPLQTKASTIVAPDNLKNALDAAIAFAGYPNIGTDVALGVRTVFASIPYFVDGFVTSITGQLQSVVDADIFLLSGLAEVTKVLVQITGDVLVATTQAIARVVATLTGSGTIAPTDPPLPPPSADSVLVGGRLLLPASVLT